MSSLSSPSSQSIAIGDQTVPLPAGINVAQWALERVRWQNPRIRAFLGCSRMLGEVLESNYAILHCSPDRLLEIWRKVERVSELIGEKIAPLLSEPSCIPQLEQARTSAQLALRLLSDSVLKDLDRFPTRNLPPDRMVDFRKLLCVSIGQIHSFLQETFGELMAADPRSQHNADYFLSRRFPQDIEEAEWLHVTVQRLQTFLAALQEDRENHLSEVARSIRRTEILPSAKDWQPTRDFLELIIDQLTPKLRELLALRGIRFSEMEVLDRYVFQIPTNAEIVLELHRVGFETANQLRQDADQSVNSAHDQAIHDMMLCHRTFSRRLVHFMGQIDHSLCDLSAFVPLWLEGVEKRRALMLRRPPGEGDPLQEDSDIDAVFSEASQR